MFRQYFPNYLFRTHLWIMVVPLGLCSHQSCSLCTLLYTIQSSHVQCIIQVSVHCTVCNVDTLQYSCCTVYKVVAQCDSAAASAVAAAQQLVICRSLPENRDVSPVQPANQHNTQSHYALSTMYYALCTMLYALLRWIVPVGCTNIYQWIVPIQSGSAKLGQ